MGEMEIGVGETILALILEEVVRVAMTTLDMEIVAIIMAIVATIMEIVATIMVIVATIMETMEIGVGETIQVSILEVVEVEAMELAIVATIMGMEKMDGLVAKANMII